MKKYLIKRADGGCSILSVMDESTFDETLVKTQGRLQQMGADYVSHSEISDDDLPANRKFRDAWICNDSNNVEVDLVKSQGVIRDLRNLALQKIDVEVLSEQRKPDGDVDALNLKAQMLRDVPSDPRFSSGILDDLEQLYDLVHLEFYGAAS